MRWLLASLLCFATAAWFAFSENLPVRVTDETPLYIVRRNGQTGVVTTGDRIVVPFVWRSISGFDAQGMATVETFNINEYQAMRGSPLLYGVINRSGKLIIPTVFSDVARRFDDRNQYVGTGQDGLAIYDRNGTELLASEWRPLMSRPNLWFDSHGLIAAKREDDIGWIDRNGVLRVRAPDGLTPYTNFDVNGLAIVKSVEDKMGCVDLNGRIVIAAEWFWIRAGAWGGDNGTANPNSDDIVIEVEATSPIGSPHLHGLLSRNGTTIAPAIYDRLIPDRKRNLAIVRDANEKWGCVDDSAIVPSQRFPAGNRSLYVQFDPALRQMCLHCTRLRRTDYSSATRVGVGCWVVLM